MAGYYDPKTKRYVAGNNPATTPKKNYNFKLPIDEFNKKYNTYRYTPDEFKALSRYGYVGSFGGGALGFKAPAYDVKKALTDLRKDKAPEQFTLPQNYSGSNIVDLAATPNPTGGEMGAWYSRAKDFNLADYIRQYGHAPSEDSVYYQIYKPSAGIKTGMEDYREQALKDYRNEKDQAMRSTIYALSKEIPDPNIRATLGDLPTLQEWTAGQRKKANQILSDFGLTGLGTTTVPYDLESKYMLPLGNASGIPTGGGTTASGVESNSERSGLEKAAINSIPIFGPIINGLSESETVRDLVASPTSPLAPTPADQVNAVSFIGNFIKGAARAGLGFPMGVAEMVSNPIGTTKAMLKDYEYRYGSAWGNEDSQFVASSLEDPLAPVLDVLGLVPMLGAGVKAAQVGKIAATTTRGAVMAGALSKVDEAANVARARALLDSLEGDGFVRMGDPEAVAAARKVVEEADLSTPALVNGKVSRQGMSAREFARVQRMALNGDVRAELAVGEMAPRGYMGLNSGYAPSFVDRAAAFFEPRWTTFNQADVMPKGNISKADAEALPQQLRTGKEPVSDYRDAPIRFAGSPLARGAQKSLFAVQKAVAAKGLDPNASPVVQRASGAIAKMPLIGFNFRYAKAIREDVDSVGTMVQREMLTHRMMEELIDVDGEHGLGRITDAEQLALMSQVSGRLYSPEILRSIIIRNFELARDMPGSIDENVERLLQLELDKFDSPEFMDEYTRANREMLDESTERGKRLAKARDVFRRKMDLAHHEAGIELGDMDVQALERIYAPAINALRLEPETILREISANGRKDRPRVARLNAANDLFQILRQYDMPADSKGLTLRERIDRGEFDEFGSRADINRAYDDMIESYKRSADALAEETAFRSKGGAPFIIVDSVYRNDFGSMVVRGRIMRVNGKTLDGHDYSRSPVDAGESYEFPMEIFSKKKRNKSKDPRDIIKFHGVYKDKDGAWLPDEAFRDELTRASLNYTMKMFPDARDFSDKIGTETYKGAETFAQRQMENTIAASGFLDYHLKTQFKAHMNAVDRRFNKDIQKVIEDAAIPITMANFNVAKGDYVALRTVKLFTERNRAEHYASNPRLSGFSEPGEVMEVTINGKPMYATRMRFVDASKIAMKEAREGALLKAEDWEKQLFESADLGDFASPNDLVMVIPRRLADDLTKSYERSSSLAAKIFSGSTDIFKLMALSLNPRFVSQQIFGGAVMMMLTHPMQSPHIMAAFMQYGYRNMMRHAKRRGRGIDDSFVNHKEDYDIFMNKFIRDFEDNIYMQDAQDSFITRMGDSTSKVSQRATRALNIGYTISFALEKNLRVAVLRLAAKEFPGFKAFLDSDAVAARAAQGMPDLGYPTISKFNAAVDLLSDKSSPYYNPMFLREIRHSADMVSGNYRDFTKAERMVRNTLIPFYAWTRHSAMFTKRLVQERPLTANAVYNVGNYGYEQIYERGGLPDWMLESVPMPDWVEGVLGLDPSKENRVGFGSINPFGTTSKSLTTAGNLLFGGGLASPNSAFEFTNPFINAAIEQQTGKSLLTGAPNESANRGLIAGTGLNLVSGLPLPNLIVNAYKSEQQLNKLRGNEDPMDIFKDPNDPNSKLSVPEEKLNTKFPTFSPAGLFNMLSPVRAYSVDRKQMGEAIDREFEQRGLEYQKNQVEFTKGAWRTINALTKWKNARDHINNVWMPEFGANNPELAARVVAQLQAEYPKIPDGFPADMVAEVLAGTLTVPDAAARVGNLSVSGKISLPVKTIVVNPDSVELAQRGSHKPDTVYDRPAGSLNTTEETSIDPNGYIRINGKFSISSKTGKPLRVRLHPDGNLVLDEQGLPVIIDE